VYLGKGEVRFAPPGGHSQARWMGKALYGLLMFLFREEFHLTNFEVNDLRKLTVFLVRFYIVPWFRARQAALAPATDLKFLQDLRRYHTVDKTVADTAAPKLTGPALVLE